MILVKPHYSNGHACGVIKNVQCKWKSTENMLFKDPLSVSATSVERTFIRWKPVEFCLLCQILLDVTTMFTLFSILGKKIVQDRLHWTTSELFAKYQFGYTRLVKYVRHAARATPQHQNALVFVPFREKAPNPDDDGSQKKHGNCVANSINGVRYATDLFCW